MDFLMRRWRWGEWTWELDMRGIAYGVIRGDGLDDRGTVIS
jgi:hypothetical protein